MDDHGSPGPTGARTSALPRPDGPGGHDRVRALDGLRGLAVVAVIAFHADLLPGGYLGVDLFFVLSGYLITSLLLAEHRRSGTIGLGPFWARRARRLLPALIVLIAVAAVVELAADAAHRAAFAADGAAALAYVANWRGALGGGGYWAAYEQPGLLDHTWSLAIEEQFYLVWPLVAIVVLGRGPRRSAHGPGRLLAVCLVGAAASAALLIGWSVAGGDPDRLYLGTDTRAAAILLGAALACVVARRTDPLPPRQAAAVAGAGWLGAAWLAVAWWRLEGDSTGTYRGGLLACGLAAVAVIASVTTVGHGRLARLLAWRPLVAAGLVSYGLYLWHWPIFVWLDEQRVGWSGAPLLVLQLTLTVAVTLLSYRLVEMPVRRGAPATRPALAAGTALLAVVGLLAVVVALPDGRIDPETAAATITRLGPLPAAAPSPSPTDAPDAVPGAGGDGPLRLLIAGDSVGATVAEGVLPHQSAFGIEARSVAVAGCGVARDNPRVRTPDGREIDETRCATTTASWAEQVDGWQPDAVLIVLGWPGQTERFVEGAWRRPCDPTFDRWYAGEVTAAVTSARRSGSAVAITTTPYFRPTPEPNESDASTDCLNRTYREVAAAEGSVAVVDLAAYVCPDGRCALEREGVELRPDGLHFAGASSVWVADWLLHAQWRAVADAAGAPPA